MYFILLFHKNIHFGTQQKHLIEAVLMSTHNKQLCREMGKILVLFD